MHITFLLDASYFPIIEDVKEFVFRFLATNETVTRLKQLIMEEVVAIELQVLGIIGKMLSGPWMSAYYTDLSKQKDTIDTMIIVKGVIEKIKVLTEAPMSILSSENDFF